MAPKTTRKGKVRTSTHSLVWTRVLLECSSFNNIGQLTSALYNLDIGVSLRTHRFALTAFFRLTPFMQPNYRYGSTSGILEDWLSSKKLTVSMDEAVAKQIAKNAGRIDKLIQKQLKKRNAAYDRYNPYNFYHEYYCEEWTAVRKLHSESEWRVQLCR